MRSLLDAARHQVASVRNPLAAITRRFAWGRDGSCWSFTTVPALPYNPAAPAAQEDALSRLLAVGASMPGEFAMWGLCQPWDDDDLRQHQLDAYPNAQATWAPVVEATMASLNPLDRRFRRVYYLAVRVKDVRHKARLEVDARVAVPPAGTLAAAEEKAAILDRRFAQLGGRPSTATEIAWIVERVVSRGSADLAMFASDDELCGDSLAELADCEIENGGPDEGNAPLFGRWCRVDSHYGRGFQANIGVEKVPPAFEAPGAPEVGEWLARVERLAIPVDWFVGGTIEDAHTATKKVRVKLRQMDAEHTDTGHDRAGPRPALHDAVESLKHQEAELAATGQPGLIFTTVLTVGCSDSLELEQRVAAVEDLFAAQDYTLTRRLGRQKALLYAQLPGHRFNMNSPLWRYRQHSMAAGFAGSAPFCGSVGGDPTGLLIGVDAGTGIQTPLFWQAGYAASINQSPSMIICGELGGGKSYTAKRIACEGVIPAGGQVLALDFTQSKDLGGGARVGEWVHLASVLKCTTAIVDVDAGDVSIDPLALGLPVEIARRMLTAALLVACNYPDDSRESDLIAKAVAHVAAGECGGRAPGVITWLTQLASAGDPIASEIVDRLTNAAAYMPALFETHRQPPDLTAQYIVFAGPNLKFPTWEELTNPELAQKVTRDKRAGQAILTLVADLCSWRAKTTSTPTAIVMDEFWRVTATPRGQEIVNELVTEGRRYDAMLVAIIQNVARLTADIRSFAGQVMVFRCRGEAAQAAADLIGVDVAHVLNLREIRKPDGSPASGYCYWRDPRGRLVLARILRPVTPGLADAAETTPVVVGASA